MTTRKTTGNVVLWVLQILVVAAFLMVAYSKLSADPDAVGIFDRIGLGRWFMYAVGGIEVAGALGLLVPRLCGLAALGLAVLLIGAIVTQLSLDGPLSAIVPAVYLVPVAVIAWCRRGRTRELLSRKPATVRA